MRTTRFCALRTFSNPPLRPALLRHKLDKAQKRTQAQFKPGGESSWATLAPRLKTAVPLLLAIVTGVSFGTLATSLILPPALPEPGSAEDEKLVADLQNRIDDLFLTQIYRGKCLGAGRVIRGEHKEGWREIGVARREGVREAEVRFEREKHAHRDEVRARETEVVDKIEVGRGREERVQALRQQAEALGLDIDQTEDTTIEARRSNALTKGALGGGRGLAAERVFWNSNEPELVAVVWLGEALTGWPRVVHGGLLATVLQDKVSMAANLLQGHEDLLGPSSFELQYKKPTYAAAFYVIRAVPKLVTDGKQRVIEVDGVLETAEGQACVEVRATLGR